MRSMITVAVTTLFLTLNGCTETTETTERTVEADYPLDTCVVSGEKLDSMGGPITVEVEGRQVKLCCDGCIDALNENPERYLSKLDEAKAAHDH
ncbi:MAG: hypothetical protein JJU36_06815 [Phycisphaeraceae bacterium]|nr:hypothetical protein [Phycisphaeraceae bacterium]